MATELDVPRITGIAGRDGSYLAELLLSKAYEVHGVVRRTSSLNRRRIDPLRHASPAAQGTIDLHLHCGDLNDAGSLQRLVRATKPAEGYNLAARSHVGVTFEQPEYTADVDGLGTTQLFGALRNGEAPFHFYHASTSKLSGATPPPRCKWSPFGPSSFRAVAKLYAHWMAVCYRKAHAMSASNDILFSHESPRRGENFLARKATRGVAAFLKTGTKGSRDARRDWGHARDYVDAMWVMLQQPEPSDYVIGTGISRAVQDLVEPACGLVGLAWPDHVDLNLCSFRPTEVPELLSTRARTIRSSSGTPGSASMR